MKSLRPYPEYKACGAEWLGEIPARWLTKRLKFVAAEPLKYGANESAEANDPNLPRFIRITDIKDDGTLHDDTFKSLPEEVARPFLLKQGDLLLARSGATVGKTFMYRESWGKACHAGYLIRCRVNPALARPEFVAYFATTANYWGWLSSVFIQATIQNVSAEKYANLLLPIPPLDEQSVIVRFLDQETSRIDGLVAKKERLIELLQEKRTALISHAVTKGLNPNAPMKDSGVEWLGEIPAHWEVKAFKRVTTRVDVGIAEAATHAYAETGVPILRSTNVRPNRLELDDVLHIEPWFAEKNRSKLLFQGDIVTVRTGNAGVSAVVPESLHRSQCFTMLISTLKDRQVPEFFCYLLNADAGQTVFKLDGWGTAQVNISVPILKEVPVVEPPFEEQKIIVDYVKSQTAKLDALIAKTLNSIERLREYRTALISAAVTGKIDVRQPPPSASEVDMLVSRQRA
jgi:type I restriction enzyme, S subunit